MMKLSTLVLGLSLAACSVETSGPDDIATTPLSGMVGGQPWTFQAGHTSAFLSEGEPDFFATLFPAPFTQCGFSEPQGNHLILSIPKAVGTYELSLSRNMTFVVGNNNLIGLDGTIVVDEVTPTTVKGGIVASYDSQNDVNGRFQVTVCAE